MRTTIVKNRGVITTDIFPRVTGAELINCFGEYLPHKTLKKFECDITVNLYVRMSVYEGVDMMILIDGINVYNSCITHDDCSAILLNLDGIICTQQM